MASCSCSIATLSDEGKKKARQGQEKKGPLASSGRMFVMDETGRFPDPENAAISERSRASLLVDLAWRPPVLGD